MPLSNRSWPFLLLAVLACRPAGAVEPLQPGAWEMQRTISVLDAGQVAYRTMSEAKETMCLSPAYLAQDPFTAPDVDRKKFERVGRCTVTDERRNSSGASWRLVCQMNDGSSHDMVTRNSVARDTLQQLTESVSRNSGSTSDIQIRAETTAVRKGECTQGMATP